MSNLITKIDSRGVAFVTLNRPEIHNAFDEQLISALIKEFSALEKNPKVKIAALMGKGESFCAGADLNWMKKMAKFSKVENYKDAKNLAKLFSVLHNFKKPLLAKVHGNVLGGGVGLVAVCDFIIASNQTRFGLTEVKLGLVPAVISPYVLSKIGKSNAHAFFLSGIRFGADKAKEMGLIHQTCEADDLNKEFERIVDGFLKAGPRAAVSAKELLKKISPPINEKTIDLTCKFISNIRVTAEAQEGMNALLEKRLPNWVKENGN
jgi:methylglutaconyl-CoA hydratase